MISRRSFGLCLAAIATSPSALATSPSALATSPSALAATAGGGNVAISPEDVAWFRQCRSVWIDCESGAPGLIPGGTTVEAFGNQFDTKGSAVVARMEKTLCAFFLHAAFGPGSYRFAAPVDGRSDVIVTSEHIKLLQHSSWRTSAIDCKRPYGDYTNYEIDMARALGLEVTRSSQGYDEVAPEVNARMDRLHREMLLVLQAYVEHAEMAPGPWFIPYDGWAYPIEPRCVPVTPAKIATYKAAMASIIANGMTLVDQVVPRMQANALLFDVDPG